MKRIVFISHSSADLPIAERLCAYLEEKGVPCWIAPRDVMPGKNYGAAIIDAIDECRVFVLLLSSQSNKSRQVVREVERAASSDSVILPFRIENVQPSRDLAFYVSAAHWLDAVKPPVEDHFNKLLTAIHDWERAESSEGEKTLAPPPPPPPPVPIAAASRQPGSRVTLFIATGIAAAVVLGAFLFYKLQPLKSGSSSTLEPSSSAPPTATASPTATPPEPSPTATPAETPPPMPIASPAATAFRLKPGERLRPNVSPAFTTAPSDPADLPPAPQPTTTVLSTPPGSTLPRRPIVREVAASSSMDSEHRPNYAFDGRPDTGWVTKGGGKGQTLFAHFKSPARVTHVSVLNGDGDAGRYRTSSRIKTVRILLSDGTNQLLTFKDEMKTQTFELKTPVTATWVKFEIVSVYPGKTKQTGIFEIGFNDADDY